MRRQLAFTASGWTILLESASKAKMIEDRSALGYLIKVIVILLSHRRVVVAIGAGILLVGVGHVSCRHVRDARRATAWMENEFGRLGDTVDQILSHEGDGPCASSSSAFPRR